MKERLQSSMILLLLAPLAALAASDAAEAWRPASRASQLEALAYIETLELARTAGPSVTADALGIRHLPQQQATSTRGAVRDFGGVELVAEMDQRADHLAIIVKASGGCIERDVAKARLLLGRIVWAPLADSPAPVFGYAHFQGGSASTVFFDAAGSKCLSGVSIEDPARLQRAIEAASRQEPRK